MIRLRVFLGEAENVTTNYVCECFSFFFVEREGEKWRGSKLKLRMKGRNLKIVS